MIKTIREGNMGLYFFNTLKIKTFECPLCACIFVADEEDYKTRKTIDGLSDIQNIYFCECPCCESEVTIF